MNKYIITLIALVSSLAAKSQFSISGGDYPPVEIEAEASSGLDKIYVIHDNRNVTASYIASSPNVVWHRFSNMGGAYAEPVQDLHEDGNTYSISLGEKDMGYIIEDGDRRFYYWVTNYSNHQLSIDGLSVNQESDCTMAILDISGTATPIMYYTINGQGRELSRELRIEYISLEYDKDSQQYEQQSRVETVSHTSNTIYVPAPLCDTEFSITGDRFLQAWGLSQEATSQYYNAIAVEAVTSATQAEKDSPNEKPEETSLGGSAPCEITFEAAVTDAIVFKEWQVSRDAEFNIIDLRYNTLDFTFVFKEQGTQYIRFVGADADATCEFYGETYQVFIGESRLECPNAFSPGASEGVNDEWKVSYKSIIEFECHIFNRWGVEICSFSDPSMGWDGKYKGKLVPAGVYFYVIKAKGSDDKKYNLSGDINVIKYKVNISTVPSE